MVDWIIESCMWLWEWLVDTTASLSDAIMNGFVSDLPIFDDTGFAFAANYLEVANQWLPLDLLVVFVAAMWTSIVVFIIGKYIWLAIPTSG